jgi:hypothetical protein
MPRPLDDEREKRLLVAMKLLTAFRMERMAYMAATLLAVTFLLVVATILLSRESYVMALGMFGSSAAEHGGNCNRHGQQAAHSPTFYPKRVEFELGEEVSQNEALCTISLDTSLRTVERISGRETAPPASELAAPPR